MTRPVTPAAYDAGMDEEKPSEETPWFAPGHHRVGIPRQRQPGAEVWRLYHPDGRVQTCELRDDSRSGAGWDVMILENGEPLFSRRCADERGARFVALSFKQDTMRTGWLSCPSVDG